MIRKTLLIVLVTLMAAVAAPDYSAAGIDDNTLPPKFLQALQQAVAANQRDKVAGMVVYPIQINDGGKRVAIKSAAALLQKYDVAFNGNVKKKLAGQKPGELFVNSQGVMIGDGELWFNLQPDGKTLKVTAINN